MLLKYGGLIAPSSYCLWLIQTGECRTQWLSLDDLVNWFWFDFDMTSNWTLTKAIQNEQLMQLLDKQDRTLDINWQQVLNIREIVGKLVETMWLWIEGVLSEEEAQKAQDSYQQHAAQLQQEMQARNAAQQWWEEWASVAWMAWAGTPVELMPNPNWETTPQQ